MTTNHPAVPDTMKAVRATSLSLDSLDLVTLPVPEVKPGEVLIQVRAASLNYRDLAVLTQNYYPTLEPPYVPCSDASGEIVALGADVRDWSLGDRVTPTYTQGWHAGLPTPAMRSRGTLGVPLTGVLQEYITVPAADVVALPPSLSHEQASTLPIAACTAWNALRLGELRPDKTVLVQGTGGVSTFAIQFAKAAGAQVVVTSSSDEKLARAEELGADVGINYRTSEDWPAEVKDHTDGRGVDVVIETGGATLSDSLRAVAWGGYVGVVGFVAGYEATIGIRQVLAPMVRLQGIAVGSRESFIDMNRAIERHNIRPVIARTFGMEEARTAFQTLADGADSFGKLVVSW